MQEAKVKGMFPVRRIPMDKMNNVRDLGGYAAKDGRVTKFGRMLRADSLSRLTERDIKKLEDYGIRTVIDLRSPYETSTHENSLLGHPYITVKHIYLAESVELAEEIIISNLGDYYVIAAQLAKKRIKEVMENIANAPLGGVLFHCTAGKDRTGLIAALLLAICGVAEEDIIADYQVSETYNFKSAKKFLESTPDANPAFFTSKFEDIRKFLDYIDSCGSAEQYLLECGLSVETINTLRSRLLD